MTVDPGVSSLSYTNSYKEVLTPFMLKAYAYV